jgi:hypothetical protein
MVNLVKKIQGEVGLLESNLITLVQEGVFELEMQFGKIEFAFHP